MLLAPFLTELLAEHLVTGSPPAMLRQFLPDRFPPTDGEAELETDYYARYASGSAGSPSSTSTPTSADAPPASTTASTTASPGNTTSKSGS